MIRSDSEYQQALARIDDERRRLHAYEADWAAKGFGPDEITALREPLEAFCLQLVEEVRSYERLKRGEFAEIENLSGLGQTLVGLRIARGITQRELARRLGVDEALISRDERNEYHGITVERARRILEALGARLVTRVEFGPVAA